MATLNFNQDQCILCGQCVEKCPFGALEILDNKIEINASCKMCKLCVKSCPVQAVGSVRADRKSERACCKDQSSGVCGADRRRAGKGTGADVAGVRCR